MVIEYHVAITAEIDSDPATSQRIPEISGKQPEARKMQGRILLTGYRGSMDLLIP